MGRRGEARVDLQEAAELLGISSDAVRKRAKRGTMPHETGADGRLYVWVDIGETDDYPTGDQGPGRGKTDQEADTQAELVDSLLDQVTYMREQLAEEREAHRRADTIIAQLSQASAEQARTIRALEPPRDERDAPRQTASDGTEGVETPAEQVGQETGTSTPSTSTERRSSWWRRFFGFDEQRGG